MEKASGEFLDARGRNWRVDIEIDDEGTGLGGRDLWFSGRCPVSIEWEETDKIEPVQGSSMTVEVECEHDREFTALWSTQIGRTRGSLWLLDPESGVWQLKWRGVLDTETYEEPYTSDKGYDVTLTFTDLGCLKRLKPELTGIVSVGEIVRECRDRAFLGDMPVELVTAMQESLSADCLTLESLSVDMKNFEEEDGEKLTLREVLEETLRPLGWRLVQRDGRLLVYDLEGLRVAGLASQHRLSETPEAGDMDSPGLKSGVSAQSRLSEASTAEESMTGGQSAGGQSGEASTAGQSAGGSSGIGVEEVWWSSTDQMLSADKVYNNVTLTFSPAGSTTVIDGSITPDDVEKPERWHTFFYDTDPGSGGNIAAFKVGMSERLRGVHAIEKGEKVKWFVVDPIYSGQEEAGVVYGIKTNDYRSTNFRGEMLPGLEDNVDMGRTSLPNVLQHVEGEHPKFMVMKSSGRLSGGSSVTGDRQLRVTAEVMFDPRYNPYEGATERSNESGKYEGFQDKANFGYIPARLVARDAEGNALCHYENAWLAGVDGFSNAVGSWKPGEGRPGDFLMAFYDETDRKSKTGFCGWQKNKQIIGYYRKALPKRMTIREDGEYMPLPFEGTVSIDLEVWSGVVQFDYKREVKTEIYRNARWLMYRNPKVELVDMYGLQIEPEDIELKAWLDRNAEEGLEIETIVGSAMKGVLPTAQGLLRRSDGKFFHKVYRAGAYDYPERLLLNMIYSQYATRHTVLSGTARTPERFGLMTDAASEGVFLITGERADIGTGESEITMVELSEEVYVVLDED